MALAVLHGCAVAPVTWEMGSAGSGARPVSYHWGAVESRPSGVVGDEVRRVVDRVLQGWGLAEAEKAELLVVVRFDPFEAKRTQVEPPPPDGALAGAVTIGPSSIQHSSPFVRVWFYPAGSGRETVVISLVDQATNCVLCRGRAVFDHGGYADSVRVRAVRSAIEGLMAACPLRR